MQQNPWFVLAEILAILSGSTIVASGMFLSFSIDSASLVYNLANFYITSNRTIIGDDINAIDDTINELLREYIDLAGTLLYISIGLALLSLVFWYRGYKYENSD